MDRPRGRRARNAAIEAGLAILHEIGLEAIERRIGALTTAIKDAAIGAGYTLVSPVESSGHGALITIRSTDDHRLVDCMAEENIVVSCRNDNLRISPHFYNNQADIDHLFRALHKHRELLA